MHRKLRAVALLVSLAFATTVSAQIQVGAPLPSAQSENHNALVAKAQAALDAKRWSDAEAALKELLTSESRWEYSAALGNAQYNQGHYADSLEILSARDRWGAEQSRPGRHRRAIYDDRQRRLEAQEERRGYCRVEQGGGARRQSGCFLFQSLRDHVQHRTASGKDRCRL